MYPADSRSFRILPSRSTTWRGSPQSRQGKSTVTVLPGKSQQTASDSNAHWPNHFCWPSMVMRYWVGRLLKGAKETIWSVRGIQPSRYARGEEVVEGLSAFFHRKTEFGCQFRVKRRLAGFHHAFHDGMKGLVEHRELTHGLFFLSVPWTVIPAKAGIRILTEWEKLWTPAFAGVTTTQVLGFCFSAPLRG